MKKLLGDVAVYGACGTLSRFIGIFLVPVYTRLLSPDEYGVIGMMLTLNALFSFLTELQMTAAVGRFFYTRTSRAYRSLLVSSAIWVIAAIAAGFAILISVFNEECSMIVFKSPDYAQHFYLLSGFTLVISTQGLLQYVLRLERRKYWFVFLTVLVVLVTVLSSILFVVTFRWGVAGALGGQLLGGVSGLILAAILNRHLFVARISKRVVKKLLWFGVPSVPARAGAWLQIAFGQIWMLQHVGLNDLGLYSLGMKFASVAIVYRNAFQMGWYPHAMAIADKPDNKKEYSRGVKTYLMLGVLLTIPFVFMAKPLIELLCNVRFLKAYRFVGILSLAYLLQGMMCVSNIGIMVKKKTGYISIAYLLSLCVTIGATVGLSRIYGELGIALGLLLGNTSQLALVTYFSQKLYPIAYSRWLLILCLLVYCGATCYSLSGIGGIVTSVLLTFVFVGSFTALTYRILFRA